MVPAALVVGDAMVVCWEHTGSPPEAGEHMVRQLPVEVEEQGPVPGAVGLPLELLGSERTG